MTEIIKHFCTYLCMQLKTDNNLALVIFVPSEKNEYPLYVKNHLLPVGSASTELTNLSNLASLTPHQGRTTGADLLKLLLTAAH